MAAILDDEGVAGIAAHIRQRLRQNRGLGHGVGIGDQGRQGTLTVGSSKSAFYCERLPSTTVDGSSAASAKLPSVARSAPMPRRLRALVKWISGCAAAWAANSAAVRSATDASSPAP